MKTIRVDGRTYASVEVDENVACKGCVFYTVGWDMNTPRCTAANIPEFQCVSVVGDEEKNVIFEELEKFKEHTEYPVGKVLAFEGEVVEVVKVIGNNNKRSCDGCALRNYYSCFNVPCIPTERADEKYIKFKKHVTED